MISMDKEYTADGHPVRLLCVDGPGFYPIVGIVDGALVQWTAKGEYLENVSSSNDLVEVKPKVKVERWFNIMKGYGTVYCTLYLTKQEALNAQRDTAYKMLARAVPFVWEGEDV